MCYNSLMDISLKKFIKENYVKPKNKKNWTNFFCFWKRNSAKGKVCEFSCTKYSVNFREDLQETFVECLFKIIDGKGLKDSEVYKKANLDRRLFSKIRCSKNYSPSKNTTLALAIGLELNLEETKNFLEKAGFALSKSILTDVIVEYFIINKKYDIFKINQTLDDYKIPPLGNCI